MITLLFSIVLAVQGCQPSGKSPADKSWEDRVVIGIANEIPYGYKTPDGEIKGEAPDIIRIILQKMGIKNFETVVTEFGSLIPGLKAGRFDIIAAGMYITPKRCRQVIFSEPTYVINESFLVLKGNPGRIHSYNDIRKNSGFKLGVMAGAVEYGYAKSSGIPRSRIVVFPDNFSGLAGLKSRRINAFAGTNLTIAKLAEKEPGAEMARPFKNPVLNGKEVRGYGAFGFRKEDGNFVREFNRHLTKFIGSAGHRKMVKPYGFTGDNLPGDISTRELCSM